MTEREKLYPEWREKMSVMLDFALQRGADWQAEIDFATAILAILDGETPPTLPEQHPYAQTLADILKGIGRR
jgi:hypothetical protein